MMHLILFSRSIELMLTT